ncbi:molecular chaperone DnaJ [Phenylobacterium sp. Root77]|jgi:DnaJ-domain-containing protein 1|uniref:J domain-containing protein n=1 Tax=unclassified Phenylobacterium TaxID=2640670 RepID=UPI0007018C49|nr:MULTISPECIES: DnaJ domain-containing protein [unclassified Phenylobacterium]KQW71346.1 molecular chaperone DnaJ [Phenylobacterium sp. Root1277]KQW94267.1 molecular chaperone DnaJ [Phenylobacterium sp. Root1290]KRC43960.1 molecular chaperone DnaJ [Phenylobacterium sp. Root77]
MLYLAIGCAALLLLVWLTRGKPMLKRREWRFLAGALAIACFAAAAYVGVRGGWGKSIVLVVMGLWLAVSTRRTGMIPPPSAGRLSDSEARSILGVGPDASEAEIKEAYGRLMRMAHPDKGGTSGLAAQLNAARDRLLKK